MYSPTKEDKSIINTRMNPNINKYIIKGRRKIKTIEEIKNYSLKSK
jgi:hypothetical protein